MKLKRLIKNLSNPKNWYYAVQGKYRRFVKRQYNKYFSDDNIDDMMFKVSQCPRCFQNGSCIGNEGEEGCGCNFRELITTNKKCPNGRF